VKRFFTLGALTFALGMSLFGCQNTAEGVKEDASNAGQQVSQAAQETADVTKDAAKDASAAMALTPKIKTAITADEKLNDTRNLIDVDSADGVVHLKGHVVSQDMKRRAGEVAQRVLNEAKATDKLSNDLEVRP
jgi:predicted small secreted protein